VKEPTAAYLASAREALQDAERILAIDIPRQAARLAYSAQFHAAQAIIFERTGKVAKTHKGVSAKFSQIAAAEFPRGSGLPASLSAAYHFKEVADYEIGSITTVTPSDARKARDSAICFVNLVARQLADE
jgi:uncharacterized protein (UPF0332 family)